MSELTAKALSDSRSFENAILERDMRMKKAGWIVAALAGLLLVFALAALILLLPLKTTTVELYTLDRQTGRIERVTTVGEDKLDTSEVLNLSQTASYVKRREGYNYFALQQDYRETQMFNSDEVNKEYLDWFNSPDAPDAVFQQAALCGHGGSPLQRTVRGHRLQHGGDAAHQAHHSKGQGQHRNV
ncbi:Pertussis toxin liberation protein E [Kluyvera cryocrescens]|uniref:Pertussis toxin liberation protein E n=1 Tax=Kluyvera cryocrescens TaxID=580 RepID=A0A485CBV5_KLUCR|nr:Pertussis toxin liberation protein E [Kluyvera cryocrescens]